MIELLEGKSIEATVRAIDGKLDLPRAIINWIGTACELGLFREGDMLILEMVQPAKLSEIALRVMDDEMASDEIVAEVHQHRRERQDADRY